MLNFCTLFNTYYLAKGLALHQSLIDVCPNFHLYIFAFDENTYEFLIKKKLKNTTVISLQQFETQALLKCKKERTLAEYCWTCTPFTIQHCIENFNLNHCTYVDADLYFYSNPNILLDEMGDNSVLITPHNYFYAYDQSAKSGIYCVQFMTFKNTINGLKVLTWWANACLKWCHAYYEDGKMGDQKYLDSWPFMFEGIYVCKNKGAGLAPWNARNFNYTTTNQLLIVDNTNIIFYHFHDLKYLSNNSWYFGGYLIPEFVIQNIYYPYINSLMKISSEIGQTLSKADVLGTQVIKSKVLWLNNLSDYINEINIQIKALIKSIFFSEKTHINKNNYYRTK